jgi:hypothetical protein
MNSVTGYIGPEVQQERFMRLWCCSRAGQEEKQTGCVLIMRQGEGMAQQRDKT